MGRLSAICTIAIVQLVLTACSGPIAPLSAQKGATIVIPIAGSIIYELGQIGFGGSDVTDHQRGTLVYKVGGPSGPELETRGSTLLYPSFNSKMGQLGDPVALAQVVSVVDIPDTPSIPTGIQSLHVVRRHQGVDHPVTSVNAGEIAILPHEVDIGGGVVVSGVPTPLAFAFGANFIDIPAGSISNVIPRPQIRVLLLGGSANAPVYAAEFEIAFPASVIDVTDVAESLATGNAINQRATTWWHESSPGVLVVSMVSKHRIRGFSISFILDDGETAILDPAHVSVQASRGWDANGAPLTPALGALTVY